MILTATCIRTFHPFVRTKAILTVYYTIHPRQNKLVDYAVCDQLKHTFTTLSTIV